MSEATADLTVTDEPGRSRYEARINGELAGLAAYVLRDDVVTFTHTEVLEGFDGRGVGSALVRAALDDVRRRRRTVVARCPFVRSYVERHEDEYADLLAPAGSSPGPS